jgi:excisionase family DNA binding protein
MFLIRSAGASRVRCNAGDEVRRMNRPNNASVEALTIEETAEVLRVSRRHLHKLMAGGDGPPVVRLGRRSIIRREALQQWLMTRESAQANG